jgi:hypothetical protein
MMPRPISTQDQFAMPTLSGKKVAVLSTSAGMYLKRITDAMLPLEASLALKSFCQVDDEHTQSRARE